MTIRKLPGVDKWRLYSAAGKNLGTFPSHAKAEQHEKDVQFFKHASDNTQQSMFSRRLHVGPVPFPFPNAPPPEPEPSTTPRSERSSRRTTSPDIESMRRRVHALETSLEFFAASFLHSAMDIDDSPEDIIANDPRVAQIAGAIRKLGIESIQNILGAGSFGTAATDPGGNVIKLTSDETEVQAGAVLRAKESLPHVVWIAGSWFISGVRVQRVGADGDTRVGVLSLEKVEPLEQGGYEYMQLSRIVARVKQRENAWPDDLFALPKARARLLLLHASEILEADLRDSNLGQVGDDVADALKELRDHGVYAIDVHGGNVGYDSESNLYKVFDIGSSSSPPNPKPRSVKASRPKKIAFERGDDPHFAAGVEVAEL